MRRFGMFSAWALSFYSRELYRDVARRWSGIGVCYLAVLLAVLWVPTVTKMHLGVRRAVRDELPKIAKQIPDVKFSNGHLQVSGEQPYFLRDPDSQEVLLIVDTSGSITSLDGRNAMFLITADKLIQRDPNTGKTQTQDLSQIEGEFQFNGQQLQKYVGTAANLVAPVAYPFCWAFSWLYRLFVALGLGLIGVVIASVFRMRLSYGSCVRLAAVAMTPPLIFNTIFEFAFSGTPVMAIWSSLAWLMPLGYLAFAMRSVAGEVSSSDEVAEFEQAMYQQGKYAAPPAVPGSLNVELESAKYFQSSSPKSPSA